MHWGASSNAWLLNVTCNDISVMYVTAHRCTGRLKKKVPCPMTNVAVKIIVLCIIDRVFCTLKRDIFFFICWPHPQYVLTFAVNIYDILVHLHILHYHFIQGCHISYISLLNSWNIFSRRFKKQFVSTDSRHIPSWLNERFLSFGFLQTTEITQFFAFSATFRLTMYLPGKHFDFSVSQTHLVALHVSSWAFALKTQLILFPGVTL